MLVTGLVGGDIEALVHLPRVGDHDLAAELDGKLESKLRLADSCRPDDDGNLCHGRTSPLHECGGVRGGAVSSFFGSGG